MKNEYNFPPFKVAAIDIDRQLAFARAARDGLMEDNNHRYTRYYNGRPFIVYTPAFIAASNRVIALEKQAEEITKPRYRFFGFNRDTALRAVLYVDRLTLSENKND